MREPARHGTAVSHCAAIAAGQVRLRYVIVIHEYEENRSFTTLCSVPNGRGICGPVRVLAPWSALRFPSP